MGIVNDLFVKADELQKIDSISGGRFSLAYHIVKQHLILSDLFLKVIENVASIQQIAKLYQKRKTNCIKNANRALT